MKKLNLDLKGKIRVAGAKTKAVADLTITKARALPEQAWNKFNGKKFITGTILAASAVIIDLYVPFAKPVSGYLLNAGVGMGLVGLGHKAVKHKAIVLKIVQKLSGKGK